MPKAVGSEGTGSGKTSGSGSIGIKILRRINLSESVQLLKMLCRS